jgi:hypothetical protein
MTQPHQPPEVTTIADPTTADVAAAMAPNTARITVLVPQSAIPAIEAAKRRALADEVFMSPVAPALADVSPTRARGIAARLTCADHGNPLPMRCRRRLEPPHAVHSSGCPVDQAGVEARGLSAYLEPQPPRAGIGDLVSGVPLGGRDVSVLGVVVAVVAPDPGMLDHRYDVQTTTLLPTGHAAIVRVHGGILRLAAADEAVVCLAEHGAAHDTPAQMIACAIAHARAAIEAAAGELSDGEAPIGCYHPRSCSRCDHAGAPCGQHQHSGCEAGR